MTIPRRFTSSKARSRRCARSSPTSPPTTRWRGSPTTCTLLSSKVDQLARSDGHGDAFAMLEQRIAALTSTLESRERPAASDNSEHLESAIRALSERIDRMQVGNDSASAFAHLEQRVSYLLERIETSSDLRSGNLGRVEEGLQDILRHLERQHANLVALAESSRQISAPPPMDSGICRHGQARTVRHPLQPVRNRPPHPGFAGDRSQHARPCRRSPRDDRRRSARSALRADRAGPAGRHAGRTARGGAPRCDAAGDGAAAETRIAESAARNRNCQNLRRLRRRISPPPRANSTPRNRRPRRRRRSRHAPSAKSWSRMLRRRAPRSNRICRRIIRSSRARDRPRGCLRPPSASPPPRARSAKFPRRPKEPVSTSSFIAAARRAAQAAAAQPVNEKAARAASQGCGKGQGRRQGRRTARSPRPSPPRSARCWSAPAWS